MKPRFVGRLGFADAVTVTNAAVGFLAVVAATVDVELAARLILFAAIFDGLDGAVARIRGSTPAGPHLDSLADVASFCVAPAALVAVAALDGWALADHPAGLAEPAALLDPSVADPVVVALALGVPALFVATGVARLGMFTAYDSDSDETVGVPTTLAASLLAALVLTGTATPALLVALTAGFAWLMVSTTTYPDLHARDALVMGVVQALAVVTPGYWGRVFAFALLFLAAGYLVFGPWFYWRAGLGSESENGTGGDGGSAMG